MKKIICFILGIGLCLAFMCGCNNSTNVSGQYDDYTDYSSDIASDTDLEDSDEEEDVYSQPQITTKPQTNINVSCSHSWKSATCTAPKTCTKCGKTEGGAKGHSWKSATCTSAKACSSCGAKSGSALGHSYSNGKCTRCSANDPNSSKKYGQGQTWTVNNKFAIKITSVVEHYMCSGSYDELKTDSAVIINYEVKNLGVSEKLKVDRWCFEVYDDSGDEGDAIYFMIYCDHGKEAGNVLNGGTGKASLPVALVNSSNSVTILLEVDDEKATFVIPISDAPQETEEPEDKLEGCTVNLDASLPATYSYYSGTKLQSSCSVTNVSFEVSGDDLEIYFTGRKTYDSRGSGQSDSCKISWKLYDDTNTVIASGTAYTLSVAVGEGFNNASSAAYNCIKPGGTYTLKLLNTN